MLELLKRFAALSLICSLLLSLLPDGAMRRTACMVTGLLLLACWSDGVTQLLGGAIVPLTGNVPSALTSTGLDFSSTAKRAAEHLHLSWEGSP